jgi:uncharacterized protein YcnI
MRRIALAATAAAVLAAPAAAQAHVTLQPKEVPAGSYARLDVRVPNERDDSGTVKVQVQFPDGIASASYEAVPGWRVKVVNEEAPEPIDLHGEEVTEQIDTVTWTAADDGAAIQPGEFQDFGLSAGLPADVGAGETLTFPAIQTYDSGEVVRWIGPPDAEEPAAEVALTAAEETEDGAEETEDGAEPEDQGNEEAASDGMDEDDDDAPMGLAVAALIVGALGLITGGASLLRSRRSRG